MEKKPNVLILFTDQQRYDTINSLGYSHMITPNLDRLVEEGCSYVNAHSANPVCMPARHDLLTGLPAKAHGYFGNREAQPIKDYGIPTLPRIFSENGYRTAAIGKMHFSPARAHHGYNEMYLMEEMPKCRQNDEYATYLKEQGLDNIQNIHGVRPHIYHIPQNSIMEEKYHGSTWVADKTIEWLDENEDKPFFLFSGWIQPHPPWSIPTEFDGIYENVELPEAIERSRQCLDNTLEDSWYGDDDTSLQKRKIREAYYTAITMVDKNIGRILDYLEEKGLMDNTVIIFTSDHGEMLQDKGYYSKELPYEGAVRVPYIIRYPEKFDKGEIRKEFIDHLDIMPTCLDICGLKYNDDKYRLPGESLCEKEKKKDRTYQISASGFLGNRRWVMCRNSNYKYVYNYCGGIEEMYDIKNDPSELNNLINTGNYLIEEYVKLRNKAIEYEKEWGPDGAIVNDDFIKVEQEVFHGSVRGKFHYWSNYQMQYFDERDNKVRGRVLIEEMQKALSNYDKSGVELNEVFNEVSWVEDFRKNYKKYGEGTLYKDIVFKNQND